MEDRLPLPAGPVGVGGAHDAATTRGLDHHASPGRRGLRHSMRLALPPRAGGRGPSVLAQALSLPSQRAGVIGAD